ncbi:type IX secretion system protein PorQ [Tenacibaculum sp. IB213877]|uniref:type IX secretion system protein PorQ n=1 Tax=Tenacibaculum sp. IB213877 TaxID=3097351 RepID=UPI002A5ABB79|nr:type IX secretion system protein PorQ [Tenacibaculum sp. IB213877]MDY0779735.1 type IX secretion system protein PorQ [Tenacibaculum sp. IB213877]
MSKYIFSLFLIYCTVSYAQTGGEQAYLFLNTSSSARQVALGGKTLVLLDNVNQPIWNPATINLNMDRFLSVNYTSYLSGISIGSASYAHRFNRRIEPIHTSIKYLNYGTLIAADTEGNETGTFNASDIAFSVGYAYQIPNSNFRVGSNVKFIYSSIANYSSSAVALDIGLIYYNDYKPYVFTLVLRNIGTQLASFNGTSEKLPFEIVLGGSYQLENVPLKLYGTIDNLQKWRIGVPNPSNSSTDLEGNTTEESISFINNAFRHVIVGAELFPKSAINLRLGYNFRRGKELQLQNVRSFGGLSFGFGLKMNKFKLNYAYSKFHSASNVSTFSLEIDLNRNAKGQVPTRY